MATLDSTSDCSPCKLLFTIGIIGILEYLQRVSDAKHGIIFATKSDAIPDVSSSHVSIFQP
jgi:hypothetical protein